MILKPRLFELKPMLRFENHIIDNDTNKGEGKIRRWARLRRYELVD